MAENKTINIKINSNTKEATKDQKDYNKAIGSTKKQYDAVLKSGDSYEKQLADINKIVKETPLNVRDINKQIQTYQSIALSAGRETPVGKEALQKAAQLRDRYIDIQNETKRLADDQRNLEGAMQGMSTGIAVYGGIQSAMALSGVESEKFRETLVKLTAAQTLMNSVNQVATALEKESALMLTLKSAKTKALTLATGAYSAVVGTTSGALKLFRIALISTGIGAIIVGIGLLVANFDKVKNALGGVTDKFKSAGAGVKLLMIPLLPLIVAIDLVKKGLQALGIIESEEEKAKEERYQANMKRIEEENEAQKARFEARQRQFDREIAMLEAEGKSSFALRQQKIADSIAIQKQESKAMMATIELFETYAKVTGEATGELDKIKKELLELNETIKDQENQLLVNVKTNNKEKAKSYKDYAKERENIARKIEDLENSLLEDGIEKDLEINRDKFRRIKEDTEKNTKITSKERIRLLELYAEQEGEAEQKIRDKYAKIDEDREKKRLANIEKLNNDFLQTIENLAEQNYQNTLSDQERELLAVQDKYFALQEAAKGNADALNEIEIARLNEENNINLKYQEEAYKNQKALDEKTKKDALDTQQTKVKFANDALGAISDLTTAFAGESEEAQKRAFKINKAIGITQAIINTAGAISAAINPAVGGLGIPAGLPGAVLAAATGAAQIATIAKTQFEGGGGDSVDAPPSSIEATPPQFNVVGDSGINQLAQLQQQPTQAYVVSGEVTTSQALDRNRVENATL